MVVTVIPYIIRVVPRPYITSYILNIKSSRIELILKAHLFSLTTQILSMPEFPIFVIIVIGIPFTIVGVHLIVLFLQLTLSFIDGNCVQAFLVIKIKFNIIIVFLNLPDLIMHVGMIMGTV